MSITPPAPPRITAPGRGFGSALFGNAAGEWSLMLTRADGRAPAATVPGCRLLGRPLNVLRDVVKRHTLQLVAIELGVTECHLSDMCAELRVMRFTGLQWSRLVELSHREAIR